MTAGSGTPGTPGVAELQSLAVHGGTEHVPSVDVCAFCCDSECDGIGCIAALDPDDAADHPAIERLHELLRAGHALLAAAPAPSTATPSDERDEWRPTDADVAVMAGWEQDGTLPSVTPRDIQHLSHDLAAPAPVRATERPDTEAIRAASDWLLARCPSYGHHRKALLDAAEFIDKRADWFDANPAPSTAPDERHCGHHSERVVGCWICDAINRSAPAPVRATERPAVPMTNDEWTAFADGAGFDPAASTAPTDEGAE